MEVLIEMNQIDIVEGNYKYNEHTRSLRNGVNSVVESLIYLCKRIKLKTV